MKKSIMVLTILALLLPTLVFSHGTLSTIEGVKAMNPLTGAYYNGYAWIFYTGQWSDMERLMYYRVKVNEDGSIHADNVKATKAGNHPVPYVIPQCCAVFNESLFFFTSDGGSIKYRYLSGDNATEWSPSWHNVQDSVGKLPPFWLPYPFDNTWGGSFAAATMNGKLYIFGVDNSYRLSYVYSSDGLSWSGSDLNYGGVTNLTFNVQDCNLSACTFVTKDGEERVMIAGRFGKRIQTVLFDGEKFYNAEKTLEWWPMGVSLVAGSVEQCSSGGMVQLFWVTKEKGTVYIYRRECDIDNNVWTAEPFHPSNEYLTNWYKFPEKWGPAWAPAFSYFKPNGDNLKKEVWCVHLVYHYPYENLPMYILRFQSDQLVRVAIESQYCGDTTYKSLWNLVGVVEGPPPFVLNGRDLQELNDGGEHPSMFEYGRSTGEAAESSHESSMELFVSVEHEFGFVNFGAEYRYALDEKFCTKTEFTTETVYETHPVPVYSYGYYVYLKPQVTRWKYSVKDWKGNPTGRYEYIFSISKAVLDFVPYDMTKVPGSPDPHDITSYLNRKPATKYLRISEQPMNWSTGVRQTFNFTGDTTISHTTTSKHTWEVHTGVMDIFDVGYGGSIGFEETHSYSFGEHIGVRLACPDPRPDSTDDIKRFEMIAYWLQPDSKDSAYWIPGGHIEYQKPWCITWEVTRIEYNNGTVLEDVKEEELAACLNLDVAGIFSDLTISYSLPRTAPISIKIYDASGRLVRTLVWGTEEAGEYTISWDGSDDRGRALSSGVYFARLEAGTEQRLAKIVLLR